MWSRQTFFRWFGILGILLLGFFLRLALAQQGPGIEIRGDERDYTDRAQEILLNPFTYTNVFRPPLYPAFLAASDLAFGATRYATAAAQALLAVVNIAVFYALAQTLFRRAGVSLLAAFLFAISVELIALTRLFYAETLFFLLSTAGFWLLLKWARGAANARRMIVAGVMIALAALTREVIGLFAILCVPVWLALVLAPQWKQALVKSAFFGIGLAVVLVPWMIRNAPIEGRFIFISTSGEHNFARDQARVETQVGIVPNLEGAETSVENGQVVVHYQPQIFKEIREQPPSQRGAYAFQRGMTVILHAPVLWFLAKLDSIRDLLTPAPPDVIYMRLESLPPEWSPWLEAMSAFFVTGVLALAVVGMWLARDHAPKLLIWLYVLFNLAIFIVTHYQPRYRLPLVILLIPYAAYGMMWLAQWLPLNHRRARGARGEKGEGMILRGG